VKVGGGDTPARRETIRDALRRALSRAPMTLRELSAEVSVSERDLPEHLEHLEKSLRAEGSRLVIAPPRCRKCGFVFRERARLTRPSKCPRCRGTHIASPQASIED
jgi:transcriptional regulator